MNQQPLLTRLIEQLKDRMTAAEAQAKAVEILQKRGHMDGRGRLTPTGMLRQSLGAEGRALDRAASTSNRKHRASDYKYDPTSNRATLKR